MQRRTAWPGLACLDRRFSALYAGDRIDALFPEGVGRRLIRQGVLAHAGQAVTLPYCVCDLRRSECVVRVDVNDGRCWGYCNEYGRPIELSLAQIQRYRFDGEKWAAWLRRKNSLGGTGPVRGAGAMFVGSGTVGGREFGLVVVAPGCHRAADVVFPEGVRLSGRPLVALLLGEPAEDLPVDASVPAGALGPDLGTIDGDALEQALAGTSPAGVPVEARYMLYSHERKSGRPIDEAEYERLHQPEVRKTYDVFIDLPRSRVWRKGRACVTVLDGAGKATTKKLGRVAIALLADYVRRPGIPMVADDTPTYRELLTGARSAAERLAAVRRSVHLKTSIVSGEPAKTPGKTMYSFEPNGMTWCVVDRLPPK